MRIDPRLSFLEVSQTYKASSELSIVTYQLANPSALLKKYKDLYPWRIMLCGVVAYL